MRRLRAAAAGLFLFLGLFVCAAPSFTQKQPPDHPIDLNAANEKELEELPGVGPTTAKAIIQFREKSGRFKRVEDLLVIRGISETKLKKMRPYVIVGPPPEKPAPPPARPSAKSPTASPAP